jgi:hypothetical protein
MTIKHLGGIFGRNPEFSNVEITDSTESRLRLTSTKDGSFTSGEELGAVEFYGSDTSGAGPGVKASIRMVTADTFGADAELKFSTTGSGTNDLEAFRIDNKQNLLLYGTATPASAKGALAIFNGTAPTGSVTNGIVLYAEDVSASSELKVRDEAGNVTTLSPHNFELIPEGPSEDMAWSYYSEKDGKRINVDMLKAIRVLEKMSGEQLVYED